MISPKIYTTKKEVTRTTVENKIGLFNIKLRYQDFNHIFFHKNNFINKYEKFDSMLSTVDF